MDFKATVSHSFIFGAKQLLHPKLSLNWFYTFERSYYTICIKSVYILPVFATSIACPYNCNHFYSRYTFRVIEAIEHDDVSKGIAKKCCLELQVSEFIELLIVYE